MALFKHEDPHTGELNWTGEDSADLIAWLRALPDCPRVTQTVLLRCSHHGADGADFCGFVQADAREGLARRRCVACASVTDLLDSGERWTFPDTYECPSCRQSLVELAVGISEDEDGHAQWLALAARCVACGRISGLTDRLLRGWPTDEVLAAV